MAQFKPDAVAQSAITACKKMAPGKAIERLTTEPAHAQYESAKVYGTFSAFSGTCRVQIKFDDEKEERAYEPFMQQCQLYSKANHKFVLCIRDSFIFGFGKGKKVANLGSLILKTACDMGPFKKTDKTFIPKAIRYGALRFEEP